MDPLTLALMFGGSALATGLGSWLQSKQPYEDQAQGWIDKYNNGNRDLNWRNSGRLTDALWGNGTLDPQTYLQKATGYSGNAADIYNQLRAGLGEGGRYSAAGMQGQFANLNPQLQDLASGVADSSTRRFGTSMEALAQAQSNRALQSLQNKMGGAGLFNVAAGPVASSLAQGAAEPLMAAQSAINQLYGQNYMGAYNPMAAFSMGNIQQAPQNMANMGQLYAALADQQYSAASPLLGLLGQQSEQALIAPQLKQRTSVLGSILGGLGQTGMQLGAYKLGQGWSPRQATQTQTVNPNQAQIYQLMGLPGY